MPTAYNDILNFWFVEITREQQFKKDPNFDAEIGRRFGDLIEAALAQDLQDWHESAEGRLANIILLDQFTRNVFRDTPKAFSGDPLALKLSQSAVAAGDLKIHEKAQRVFTLMPMMHSEDIKIQEASLPLFKEHTDEGTFDFAQRHRDIVYAYHRFPHRNKILGRQSSEAELAFLQTENSSF